MQLNVVWQLSPVTEKIVRSQVIFPYKLVIKNHSVTIEGNPILFNCSQGFTQNWHITAFLNIECNKSKNLVTKNV